MGATFSSSIDRPAASGSPLVVRFGGTIAGLGGSLAMVLWGVSVAVMLGDDTWLEPKEVAAIFDRSVAIAQPEFVVGPLFLGLAIHFLAGALLGAIFDIIYHRILRLTTDFGLPMYIGLVYGVWLWIMSYFVVLPALGAGLTEANAAPFLVQHVVFGVVTGLLYTRLSPEPYRER